MKDKETKNFADYQIGRLVILDNGKQHPVMSIHATNPDDQMVWCDLIDDKGKLHRNSFHYKQLKIVVDC